MLDQNNDIQKSLLDFHATISAKPKLSDSELFAKFPEFKNDSKKLQSAKDYAATLESGKYKSTSEFNNKFPEFFEAEKPGKGITPIKEQAPISTIEQIQQIPTTPISESIADDRKTNHEFLKSVWNTGLKSVERLIGSWADIASKGTFSAGVGAPGLGGDFKQPSYTKEQRAEMASNIKKDLEKDVFGKVKFDIPKSQQDEIKFDLSDGLGVSDFEALGTGLAGLGTDLLINKTFGGKGVTFALQAMNDAFDEYDQSAKQQGVEVNENARDFYGYTTGVVVGALQEVGFDKIFKGAPKVLQGIKSKVFADVMLDIEKSELPLTAKTIEDLVNQKTKDVMKSSLVKRYGVPALSGAAVGGIMGGATQGAKDINKFVTNAIQGSQVFDEKDIHQNFIKNIINSFAEGSAYGAVMTPFHVYMQKTDNEILNQVAKANTPEQLSLVMKQVDNAMNEHKFTEQERQMVNKSVNDYIAIKKTIPSNTNEAHQAKIIPLIKTRNEIDSDIQSKKENVGNIDESLRQQELDNLQLLQDRRDGINQQIQDIVNNKEQPIEEPDEIKYTQTEQGKLEDQQAKDMGFDGIDHAIKAVSKALDTKFETFGEIKPEQFQEAIDIRNHNKAFEQTVKGTEYETKAGDIEPSGEIATGTTTEVSGEPEFLSKATDDELARYRELQQSRKSDEKKFRAEYESDDVVKLTGENEEQYLRRKACI